MNSPDNPNTNEESALKTDEAIKIDTIATDARSSVQN